MSSSPSLFPETRWSLIDAIKGGKLDSFDALSEICEIYWYPVYAFFRDQGKNHHDAQDLTQGFFEGVLRREDFTEVSQDKGNFRAYLSAAARNFAISEYWKARTASRGSGKVIAGFDAKLADKLYKKDRTMASGDDPEMIYDRRWATALMTGALDRLRAERKTKGKGREFKHMEKFLEPNAREEPFKTAAKRLGMEEGTMRVAVCRLRARYGELLRMEIASLVDSHDKVEGEIRYLFQLMGRDANSGRENWLLIQ